MNDIKVQLKNVVKEFSGRGDDADVQAVNDVTLTIHNGEFFAMLGPSGCGKTTTLRLIAGFEQPTRGEILIDGQAMQGIPAYRRPVNTVFQDYALFPHMTVLQNVMFGLKMARVERKEALARAHAALELVRLPQIANRRPSELSGGQQQRVALARALVKQPSVLLLDEPLGALDLKLRREMQIELKQMQKELGITFVFVTHDQEEAMTMADRIAVMDQGKVLQVGRPDEIYETPVSRFVADFIGETNFLSGSLVYRNGATGDVRLGDGTLVRATLGDPRLTADSRVTVAIRPERIVLRPTDASGNGAHPTATQTHIVGEIAQTSYLGTDTRYIVRLPDASHVTVRVQNTGYQHETAFRDGQRVNILWENDNARILRD